MTLATIVAVTTALVLLCPCAFILATPTAVMASIGKATKFGILVRSGDVLERFSRIHFMAFDKTGTLTYGRSMGVGVESFDPSVGPDDALKTAASAEQRSKHPLRKAILAHYLDDG